MTLRSPDRLPAVSHPTTVVVVPGECDILADLGEALDGEFLLASFREPRSARDFIAESGRLRPWATPAEGEDDRPTGPRCRPGPPAPEAVLGNPERFRQTSAIIAGARLPGMSGAEFLAGMAAGAADRILVAGGSEAPLVLQALENGAIDGYLDPDRPGFADRCLARLRCQQARYFCDIVAQFGATAGEAAGFLGEPGFATAFGEIRRARGIVEHCLLAQPSGLLCLTAEGRPLFVLVADEEERRAAYEIAREEGAPYELLNVLCEDRLALFPTGNGYYMRRIGPRWRPYVADGVRLGGDRRWLLGVFEAPALPAVLAAGPIRSLSDFRSARAH